MSVEAKLSYNFDDNSDLTSDGVTLFSYDAENRLLSASGTTINGTLLRRYVHGPGVDEPLLWYEGTGLGTRRHLRADHLGSVVAVSDASGSPVAINTFDEYGQRGTGNDGRFQYTGQILIPELGLYYYKARMYSAEWGRFLQTDPVGYADQMNLYAYVGNDPIGNRDPSGRETQTLKINVDVVPLVGVGISFGIYFNPGTDSDEDLDFGFMASLRGAVGGDVSAGVSTSTIDGSADEINGLSTYSSVGGGTPTVGAIPGIGVDFVQGETAQNPFSKNDPDFQPVAVKEFGGNTGLLPISSQKGVELSGKLGYQDIKSMVQYIGSGFANAHDGSSGN